MKIITTRSMQLEGKHFEEGKPQEASEEVAKDAIRRGWAVAAPAKAGSKTDAPAKAE